MFFLSSKIVIVMAFFVFFNFLFLGKPFIRLWLGEKYIAAYNPLVILALSYLVAYMQAVGVNYMFSTNKHQYFAYTSIFEGISNLVLSIMFVTCFKLGITGVALGTLIAILITKVLIHPFIISKILKIRAFDYYSFFIRSAILGTALFTIAGLPSIKFNINNYFEIAIISCVFVLIAILFLFLLLNKNERTIIKQQLLTYNPLINRLDDKVNES